MGVFKPLADYCREQTLREFELPFHKIEAIIGRKLPDSALRPQYWANVCQTAFKRDPRSASKRDPLFG